MALTKISTGMLKQDAASSDLNIDAGTLYLDVSNNRVGVANTNPSEALDVDGNIVVSGTVDGRDLAADGSKLDNIESNADVTDTANVTAAGALMDSEVTNLDQVKAFDSSDYATAAQGTTADSALQNIVEDTTPQLGGNLDLNSNNITGTGNIDVTGTVTADGLTVDAALATINAPSNTADLILTEGGTNTDARIRNSNGILEIDADLNNEFGNSSIMFAVDGTDRLKIDRTGDISFYEDTGTTPKLFWDASAESLGIGITSADGTLHVHSGSAGTITAAASANNLVVENNGPVGLSLLFDDSANNAYGNIYWGNETDGSADGRITYFGSTYVTPADRQSMNFRTAGVSRMRIDSNGNLLVGTTSSSSSTAGIKLTAAGTASFVRDGVQPVYINRLTSDGDLALFAKDGSTVGSIGATSSELVIGGGDANLLFMPNDNAIAPSGTSSGGASDGVLDLGRSARRFKDLYLSGTVNAAMLNIDGGTIKLDGNYPTGTGNVALGNTALDSVESGGAYNIAIGSGALTTITTGGYNIGVGGLVAQNATTANYNVGIGMQALNDLTTGFNNIAIGNSALGDITTHNSNVAIGSSSLQKATASNNTAIGTLALRDTTTGADNVAVGTSAMLSNTTASANTAIGRSSLPANTTGGNNTAVGYLSMYLNTTASNNSAFGKAALYANTTGTSNVALGTGALQSNTTANNNIGIGVSALSLNTTGGQNVAVGDNALATNSTGLRSTAVGYWALRQSTASNNTALGYASLTSNTTGTSNSGVGYNALLSNTTGSYNIAMGAGALDANVGGNFNVALGVSSLGANTSASDNTAVGYNTLNANTTGSNNTAVGKDALVANTTASGNTAIGYEAGKDITTGTGMTAVGYKAAENTTGNNTTALGYSALQANTSGGQNTAVGTLALTSNSTGTSNTAVGALSMDSHTTGTSNAAFGHNSLNSTTTASYNTAIGGQAGRNATGERNVYLGYDAANGVNHSGLGGVYLGMETAPSASTNNYEIVIGYGATGKGTQTGFINPVGGGVYQGNNSSSWSTTSDRRIKKNIADNNDGLKKLMGVQVRNFEYRTEDEIEELPTHAAIRKEGVQLGVIAQEIQEVLPEVVKQETTGCLTVDPGNLTWYLINAVKELKTELDAAKARIATLESQ